MALLRWTAMPVSLLTRRLVREKPDIGSSLFWGALTIVRDGSIMVATDQGLAIRSQSGWSVETDAIALGFFSFAKFLMYRDLDPTTWPAADAILGHGVLQALLAEQGFQPSSSAYREDCLLDDQIQNRNIVHVVDSDSSQTIAILDSLELARLAAVRDWNHRGLVLPRH